MRHIDRTIFTGFLHNREAAPITAAEPTGPMRATAPASVPMVHMTNLVLASADRNPQGIFSEFDVGHYIAGHRVLSIDASRQNVRITTHKVRQLGDGRLTNPSRSGGMMADSHDDPIRFNGISMPSPVAVTARGSCNQRSWMLR